MVLITANDALLRLTLDCHFPEDKAKRLLNIAWEFGQKAEPCPGGYVHIWYHGKDDTGTHLYSVIEHIGPKKAVANSEGERYTERNSSTRNPVRQRKERTMPPRRTNRQAAPAPEPEEVVGTSKLDNVQKYLNANNTPTLADYAEWFTDNVADPTQVAADRLIGLAVTFYGEFQASDFNKERKAERKAEREASNGQAEPEPEPARPAARGRGARAAKPAAGKPAAPAKPARGRAAAKPSTAAVY
jgi:hypothetical protein